MRYIYKYILFSITAFILAGCSEEVGDIQLYIGNEEVKVITLDGKRYRVDETYTEEIDKGLTYTFIQLKDETNPMVAHAVELDLLVNPDLKIQTLIGNDSLRGLETPLSMAQRNSTSGKEVLVAINGGFFNMNDPGIPENLRSIPLGGEVRSNLVVHDPDWDWQTSIWFNKDNGPTMEKLEFGGSIIAVNGTECPITGVNRYRDSHFMVLFNSYNGLTTRTNRWSIDVLLKPIDGDWETLDSYQNVKCEVLEKVKAEDPGGENAGNMMIPKGHIILSGNGTSSKYLRDNVEVGDIVTINASMKTIGDGTLRPEIANLICAQSIILRDGAVLSIDDPINTGTHPRTAVGYSNSGTKIYFVVVEGRLEGRSVGLTTKQLAGVLTYVGADNGVNLDGGGSSCMVIKNEIVNELSDGSARPVIDGLSIVKTK